MLATRPKSTPPRCWIEPVLISVAAFHAAALSRIPSCCRSVPLEWRRLLLYAVLALAAATGRAGAVVLVAGNGNTSAPPVEDPGFAHVGQRSRGGLTLIYLGNGWVLTANHVGEADLKLDSVVYPHVVGSGVRFVNDDLSDADLLAFRVVGAPDLRAFGARNRIGDA